MNLENDYSDKDGLVEATVDEMIIEYGDELRMKMQITY